LVSFKFQVLNTTSTIIFIAPTEITIFTHSAVYITRLLWL